VVDVLVIPDGAGSGALAAAHTPVLDTLGRAGEVARVVTTPAGLSPGSETCIPALLGSPPATAIGRGRVDAAAYGVSVPSGLVPWRADVLEEDGSRAEREQAAALAADLDLPAVPVRGHRLLLFASTRPSERPGLRIWDDGPPPRGPLPRPTAIVCGPGAAAGCGRLLGADVNVPAGATGDVDTDLRAKLRAAVVAISERWPRVVVHVAGPDEAAHRRTPAAVIDILERLDAELLGPLAERLGEGGDRLVVCPDHGTDPHTGEHDASPVDAVRWWRGIDAGESDGVVGPDWLFAHEQEMAV